MFQHCVRRLAFVLVEADAQRGAGSWGDGLVWSSSYNAYTISANGMWTLSEDFSTVQKISDDICAAHGYDDVKGRLLCPKAFTPENNALLEVYCRTPGTTELC